MRKALLLDCTMRDGGFINDWDFGEAAIRNLYGGLIDAGVDIIELGYIRSNTEYTRNRTVFSSTADARWIVGSKETVNTMRVLILDYGQCALENIGERGPQDVDGIRVTFKKKDVDAALEMCAKIKQKGYKVFAQPVAITNYSDAELLALLEKISKIDLFAVSIVDTYGFMQKDDAIHLYTLFDRNLPKSVKIGYHAHNNFQLAYSNAVALIEQASQRDVIIDASLYGMGKSAGNASLELLMNYLNSKQDRQYDLSIANELIDTEISKYQQRGNWGYSFQYYLAATYRCHPKYVAFLINKKTVSVRSIGKILEAIPQEKATSYSESYIEKAYIDAQLTPRWDDNEAYDSLNALISRRPVLIVATGASLKDNVQEIEDFINRYDPYIIHLNGQQMGIAADAVFFKNEKRYLQYQREKQTIDCFLAANDPNSMVENNRLFCIGNAVQDPAAIDNTTLVLLHILAKAGQREVTIAGMDGFQQGKGNFANKYQAMNETSDIYDKINRDAQNCLNQLCKILNVDLLTPSLYSTKRKEE